MNAHATRFLKLLALTSLVVTLAACVAIPGTTTVHGWTAQAGAAPKSASASKFIRPVSGVSPARNVNLGAEKCPLWPGGSSPNQKDRARLGTKAVSLRILPKRFLTGHEEIAPRLARGIDRHMPMGVWRQSWQNEVDR